MLLQHFRRAEGSAIAIAAVSAAILSMLIAGVLSYIGNEYSLNFRSHCWNQALHLAEAAVEIGFAEFNYQYKQGGSGFQSGRGWTSLGGGSYSKSVTNFTDTAGNAVGSLAVTVSGVGTANPQILGVGTTTTVPFGPSVSRAVKVVLAGSSKFPVGILSKSQINLNGNNAYSDSYDSTDPTKSTGGRYDASKKQPNGDIASNSSLVDSIGIGNTDIYGIVSTGPGGTVSMGPNGSVGPTFVSGDRADTVAEGEANGWIRHDFAVDVPDVTAPSGSGSWTSIGTINNNTVINGGDWRVSDISLSGTKTLTIQGTVRLYVTGSTSISGNATIILSPGASLEVYAAGSVSISGNGVQNNPGLPGNNQWNALPSCTSVSISGNGSWIGTMYAPQAALSISGNGNLYGAVVANTITLGGNANFHYDESLRNGGPSAGYLVASWQSLRNVSGSWVAE
jgi:hypothetical protein